MWSNVLAALPPLSQYGTSCRTYVVQTLTASSHIGQDTNSLRVHEHYISCNNCSAKPRVRDVQGDTKKRELLIRVVAAMYSWQHCGTGTLSYRQPHHFSNHGSDLKRQVIMVQFLSIIFFCWIYSIFGGFFKSPRFLCHPVAGSMAYRFIDNRRKTPPSENSWSAPSPNFHI